MANPFGEDQKITLFGKRKLKDHTPHIDLSNVFVQCQQADPSDLF